MQVLLSFSHPMWENGNCWRSNDVPEVTQPECSGAGVCTRTAYSSSGASGDYFRSPRHLSEMTVVMEICVFFYLARTPMCKRTNSWLGFQNKMLTACSSPNDPLWPSGFQVFVFLVSWSALAVITHPLFPAQLLLICIHNLTAIKRNSWEIENLAVVLPLL